MKKQSITLVGLVFVLSGCSLFLKNVTTTPEQKQMMAEVMENCKYDREVCEYFARSTVAFSQPMTTTITSQDPEAGTQLIVSKMDGTGNMHSSVTADGKVISEMIVFNKVTYTKDPNDGSWWKYDTASSQTPTSFDVTEMINEYKDEFTPENDQFVMNKLGQEACGTLQCYKYEMYSQDTATEKTIVWFDTKDYLARKMEVSTQGTKTVMEFSYGQVSISEPAPIKEVPSVSEMVPQGEMPSDADLKKMMESLPAEFQDFEIPEGN